MTERRRALVLGGGVAGIAAAFELLDRGYAVEVLEARRRLGGRAMSFTDARLGDELDNGPHVMLGCYGRMRALLRRLGTEGEFLQPPSLRVAYREPGGAADRLALSGWPVPLALPWALLRLRGLAGSRARAVRGIAAALRGAPRAWTLEQWMRARGQDGAPRRYLWEPLCLSVMNAAPREVSATLFLRALRRAFGGSARRAAIWVPRAPWSAIVGAPAQRALLHAGARVTTGFSVHALTISGARVRAVAGAGEQRAVGDRDVVVSALPWHRLAPLLPDGAAVAGAFEGRPIVNVYFDVDDAAAPPDDGELTILLGGHPFQVLYRRPGARRGRFALIASASSDLDGISTAGIEAQARAALQRYYPDTPLPLDGRIRVTKEPLATFCAAPLACDRRPRPGPFGGIANLLVCGDWTQTHLPATLEGAAASARTAARRLVRARP